MWPGLQDRIRLQPANADFEPIYADDVDVQGVVIGVVPTLAKTAETIPRRRPGADDLEMPTAALRADTRHEGPKPVAVTGSLSGSLGPNACLLELVVDCDGDIIIDMRRGLRGRGCGRSEGPRR